jgi:hypothetical protein
VLSPIVVSTPGPLAGLLFSGLDRGHGLQRQEIAAWPHEHTICFENAYFDPKLLQKRH